MLLCPTLSLGSCCEITILKLLLYSSLLHLSFSRHESVGEPPVFLSQPEDITLTTEVLQTYRGIQAHLIIKCQVTGSPTPTVTWFRGESEIVMSAGAVKLKPPGITSETFSLVGFIDNSDLFLNLTAQVISRLPEVFHCRATNMLGQTVVATTRSKDVHVTFNYFNGFENEEPREVLIDTILGGAAAIKCDVLDAAPDPEIEWFSDETRVFSGPSASSMIVYVDDGRYLYIRSLTGAQRGAKYHCEVANKLGNQRAVSPTTYSLTGDIEAGVVTEYRPLEPVFIRLGYTDETPVYYPAAIPRADGAASSLGIVCPSNSNFSSLSSGLLINFRSRFTDVVEFDLTCVLTGTPIIPIPEIKFKFVITGPVNITSPLLGDASLVDRDRSVGDPVTFVCKYHGLPTPTLSWSFNGEKISRSGEGISLMGNVIRIPAPDGRHSGVYQCFVENVITGIRHTDVRSWILEVKDGLIPRFLPLIDTNSLAVRDSYLGTLIVVNPNSRLNVTIGMNFEHCPSVQWSFNGSDIASGSEYFATNPCLKAGKDNIKTTLYYSLIIRRVRSSNSGWYSAVFTFETISATSDRLFITVPVAAQVLSFEFENDELSCMTSGTSALMTCHTVGYPRPTVVFTKDSIPIIPGVGNFQRYTAVKFDQIRIRYLDVTDDASYSCQAIEAEDGPRLNGTRLFICIPPVISYNDISVFTIEMLVIHCVASGLPLPVITWTKDTENLVSDEDHVLITFNGSTMSRLVISDLTFLDNGIYACVGTSDSGNITHRFPISIGLIEPVQTGLLAGSLAGIFSILFTAHITGMIAVTCYLGIRSFLTKRRAQKNTSLKPAGGVFNLHNIIKKDKRKRSSQYSFYTAV